MWWWDAPDRASQQGLAFQSGALQPCLRSFPVFWNIGRSDREGPISLDALQRNEQGQASGAPNWAYQPSHPSSPCGASDYYRILSVLKPQVLGSTHPPKRRLTSIDGAVVAWTRRRRLEQRHSPKSSAPKHTHTWYG